jgi:site-specific recombinase XerC
LQIFLAELRSNKADKKGNTERGISAQAFNFYLQALKQFCRWMVRDGRAIESPAMRLDGLNVKRDRAA